MQNTLEQNYFLEIDEIPLFNYRKALTEGKLYFTRRNRNEGNENDDQIAWCAVYDDYLKHFGLGEKHEDFFDLQLQLIDLNLEYAETGDRFLLNEINRLTDELNKMMNVSEKSSLDDAITFVIRHTGTMIDEKQVSAKTFFKLLDRCVKEIENKNGKKPNQEE